MMYVTAGRIGSHYKRCRHFFVMRIGVKLYEMKVGRDGVTRLRYCGHVPETVTLDRYIRGKKVRLAKEHAAKIGGVYRDFIKHNQVVPAMEALCNSMEVT
jgi:hypothetical protein